MDDSILCLNTFIVVGYDFATPSRVRCENCGNFNDVGGRGQNDVKAITLQTRTHRFPVSKSALDGHTTKTTLNFVSVQKVSGNVRSFSRVKTPETMPFAPLY